MSVAADPSQKLTAPNSVTNYSGLIGSARSWLTARLSEANPHLVLLCKNKRSAEEFAADLQLFVGDARRIILFPSWETIPFERVSPQLDVSAERLAALHYLESGEPFILILSAEAISQLVPNQESLRSRTFTLNPGVHSFEEIARKLAAGGYSKVSIVEEIGEFAQHGQVIDLYPALCPHPVRLKFEEGRLSRMDLFDAESQRSLAAIESLNVTPVREHRFTRDPRTDLQSEIERIKTRAAELDVPLRDVNEAIKAISEGHDLPGIELLHLIAKDDFQALFSHFSSDTLLVVSDPHGVEQALDDLWLNVSQREEQLSREHYLIPPKQQLYSSPEQIQALSRSFARANLNQLDLRDERGDSCTIKMRSLSNAELKTRLKTKIGSGDAYQPLKSAVDKLRLDENHVAFVVGSDTRAQKLQRILLDLDIDARVVDLSGNRWIAAPHRYPVVILKGHLASGFVMPDEHLVFISEAEIFAERSYRKSRKAQTNLRKLLGTLSQLQEGDYIVHTDYGIGVYRGLKHIDVEGLESDFLQIDYADSKLYLPVHSIGKAQKFAAAEGQVPKIDKLGSSRWTKTKQKVRESVAALAGDLIKLYAARSIVKGWRHEPQGAEDERFAEDFPFDETPDQLKAIQDTISDMVADRPMDRLVCGDVGFGKTEVAVRAAFKCLQHAKQVAVLVPTTILAEQHKHTFVNRFTGYPAKIAALSRFYSPKQNQAAIAELKSGELDIIIGTHRLLSRDVTFKDLGLLIVDEEHRFGVKHKEKLKAFKKQVDVLTLTATPIPRTLHMSLLGIRDISVISTPPHDRRTIRSYVASYDETLIADAIRRELRRNGQCFFVHNRVQNIDLVSATLSALVPEARFAFAHGQMSEHQLEKIMRAFLMREIDVLVSTTIIESGLDIPNANTMIIDRADTFGLAQLYQLRGRVGRSNRQAFCYFLIPKSQRIGVQAEERLRALQALDDLGLGFNLALRDMEIRGAGNLLGKEQSGNVLAVGFELFSKILKEAVLNLKGEDLDIKESIDPEIKLGIQAFLPEFYIPDVSERLVMYQRFAGAESSQEIDDLLEEMTDRFGSTPPEGLNLAELMRYRALLRDFGVVKAELSKGRLLLAFSPHAKVNLDRIFALTKNFPGRFKFNKNLTLALVLGENNDYSITRIFKHTENLLHEVAEAALRG